MRYSLVTLLLIVLWCGTGMLAWQRNSAWELTPRVLSHAEGKALLAQAIERAKREDRSMYEAPDGIRSFDAHDGAAFVLDKRVDDYFHRKLLFAFIDWHDWSGDDATLGRTRKGALEDIPGWPDGFIHDDAFLFHEYESQAVGREQKWFLFHRRYPEWWWGHFYRVELWVLAGLTGVIFIRALRAVLARRTNH